MKEAEFKELNIIKRWFILKRHNPMKSRYNCHRYIHSIPSVRHTVVDIENGCPPYNCLFPYRLPLIIIQSLPVSSLAPRLEYHVRYIHLIKEWSFTFILRIIVLITENGPQLANSSGTSSVQ